MSTTDFVEIARDWLHSQLRAMACKVCQNYPSEIDIGDELDGIPSFTTIEHGSGCYTQSEDGGGESHVDVDESVVLVAGLLAELERRSAPVSGNTSDEVKAAADRLRHHLKANNDESSPYWRPEVDGLFPGELGAIDHDAMYLDRQKIVSHYIAEHANDDENALPLTAEILEASGWFFSKLIGGYLHDGFNFHLTGPADVQFASWHLMAVSREFGTLKTVGDLRKLLDALDIDAVVTVPKGEVSDAA